MHYSMTAIIMKDNNNNNKNKRSNNVISSSSFISGCFHCFSKSRSIIIAVIITAIITINSTMIFNFHNCENNNYDVGSYLKQQSVADTFFSSSSSASSSNQNPMTKTTTVTRKTKATGSSLIPPPLPPLPNIPSIVWQPWNQPNDEDEDDENNPKLLVPFPCYPPNIKEEDLFLLQSTKPAHTGLLFQRPTKVGSTTMTNIILRLVHNRGVQEYTKEMVLQNSKQQQPQRKLLNNNTTTTTNMKEEQIINYNQKIIENNDKNNTLVSWSNSYSRGRNDPRMKLQGPKCLYRANHGSAISYEYSNRHRKKSYLFSLLRDPTTRSISEFFHFQVSVYQQEPTDINFQLFVQRKQSNNPMIRDLTFNTTVPSQLTLDYQQYRENNDKLTVEMKKKNRTNNKNKNKNNNATATTTATSRRIEMDYDQIVTDILKSYNFIAVMERMDESLVALKLLLNLTVEEILYVKPSRTSGSFSNGPRDKEKDWRPCIYLIPSFLTSGMKTYFYGDNTNNSNDDGSDGKKGNEHWNEYIKGDLILYQAVNKSLDRTINELFGRELFEKELKQFELAQQYANTICSGKSNTTTTDGSIVGGDDLVVPMCDSTGHDVVNDPNRSTTCYIWSEGCDHKCLNEQIPHPIPKEIFNM